MSERELVYYVATTLDGFIAREDGNFSEFPWDDEYGAALLEAFPETFPVHIRGAGYSRDDNRCFDAVLMGRKTYEVGIDAGVTSPYPTLDQYVFSRSRKGSPHDAVELVSEDAVERVKELKKAPGKAIWLCGGAELATTLHEAGLIDRLTIKLNPIVFGSGIPLFTRPVDLTRLDLEAHHVFDSGHVMLDYRVERESGDA